MKNIKFTQLGIVSLTMALGACSPYKNSEINYELEKNQRSVVLDLGESFQTSLYNVKQPINILLKAPEDYKIILDNKEYADYQIKINPQDQINLFFNLKKEGKDKLEKIETHISTFYENYAPSNRVKLEEKNGKYTNIVGEEVFYSLKPGQKETYVDLHEHNRLEKHNFYYTNGTNDVIVRMVAPRYTSFVFENGTKTKEYAFKLKHGDNHYFSMKLNQDNSEHTYSRTYKFKRK